MPFSVTIPTANQQSKLISFHFEFYQNIPVPQSALYQSAIIIFVCDSTPIRGNVGLLVGLSVCLSVCHKRVLTL